VRGFFVVYPILGPALLNIRQSISKYVIFLQLFLQKEASSYLFSNNELVSDDVTMLVGKLL
jgi:hypothetical protein